MSSSAVRPDVDEDARGKGSIVESDRPGRKAVRCSKVLDFLPSCKLEDAEVSMPRTPENNFTIPCEPLASSDGPMKLSIVDAESASAIAAAG